MNPYLFSTRDSLDHSDGVDVLRTYLTAIKCFLLNCLGSLTIFRILALLSAVMGTLDAVASHNINGEYSKV